MYTTFAPREVLADVTVTDVERTEFGRALAIQNLGADAIYVGVGDTSSLTTDNGHQVAAGDSWAIDCDWRMPVAIITTTKQTAGAGTRITELP